MKPDTTMMSTTDLEKCTLSDLVDIDQLQALMDSFFAATGTPSAILDSQGTILTASGWQPICTQFHRVHPTCEGRCKESDAYIANHLSTQESVVMYECLNGLVDAACPMIIQDRHMGTVFTGQFLLAPPDEARFRKQAQEFGFDEKTYMDALAQVPIIPRERIDPILTYLSLLTRMIADMGVKRFEQLHLYQELQEKENRFRTIADYTYDWESWVDTEGRLHWVNPAVERMTGYTIIECLAMIDYPLPMIHKDDHETMSQVLQSARKGSIANDVVFRIIHKEGHICWMAISFQPVYDENETLLGYRSSVRDFTERKKEEGERARMEFSLEQSGDEIHWVSSDAHILYANTTMCERLGYSKEELYTLRIHDIDPNVTDEVWATIWRTVKEQGEIRLENVHQKKNGEIYPIEVMGTYMVFEGEEYVNVVARDISEQKRSQEEYQQLQQQIIEAQQNAIRELSTPLLPLASNIVALPLVGNIDSNRAQQVMETLLEGIATYQSDVAIVDITGVKVVDTQVAQALISTAQAVRLLGAQVVLTGIQPTMAQTLVHLGADLSGIITRATLQAGIAYAMERHQNKPS